MIPGGCIEGQSRGKSVGPSRERRGGRANRLERAAGTHRVQKNAVLLVLLGVQHVITGGRGRSQVSPKASPRCFPTPAARDSPFLAESNTHETRLVGPVWFHSDGLVESSALARSPYGPWEGSDRGPGLRAHAGSRSCWGLADNL